MGSEEIQAKHTYQSFMKSGGGKSYGAIGRRCSEPQKLCLSRGNRWKELVPMKNKRCGKGECERRDRGGKMPFF